MSPSLVAATYNTVSTLTSYVLPVKIQNNFKWARDSCFSSFYILTANYLLPSLSVPNIDLSGKNAIVTGANSGIGLQIATDLARQGATVYLACRNTEKASAAVNTIHWRVPESAGRIRTLKLDTSDLDSVRNCALAWRNFVMEGENGSASDNRRIDILVLNAGIPGNPDGLFTSDGIELAYATNFLGGFLLTHFLEPFLSPNDARIILTSSTGAYLAQFTDDFTYTTPVRGVIEDGFHRGVSRILGDRITIKRGGGLMDIYGNTKGMQVIFAKLLQERFDRLSSSSPHEKKTLHPENGVGGKIEPKRKSRQIVHAFTPGLTETPIFGKFGSSSKSSSPSSTTDSIKSFIFNPLITQFQSLVSALSVDVEQGAATGSWLCMTTDEQVVGSGNGGRFWDRQARHFCAGEIVSRDVMERMWRRWEVDAGIEWR